MNEICFATWPLDFKEFGSVDQPVFPCSFDFSPFHNQFAQDERTIWMSNGKLWSVDQIDKCYLFIQEKVKWKPSKNQQDQIETLKKNNREHVSIVFLAPPNLLSGKSWFSTFNTTKNSNAIILLNHMHLEPKSSPSIDYSFETYNNLFSIFLQCRRQRISIETIVDRDLVSKHSSNFNIGRKLYKP